MIRFYQDEMFHPIKGAYFSFKKKSTKRNLPFCEPIFSITPGGFDPPLHLTGIILVLPDSWDKLRPFLINF
jgi:hypothetical protein